MIVNRSSSFVEYLGIQISREWLSRDRDVWSGQHFFPFICLLLFKGFTMCAVHVLVYCNVLRPLRMSPIFRLVRWKVYCVCALAAFSASSSLIWTNEINILEFQRKWWAQGYTYHKKITNHRLASHRIQYKWTRLSNSIEDLRIKMFDRFSFLKCDVHRVDDIVQRVNRWILYNNRARARTMSQSLNANFIQIESCNFDYYFLVEKEEEVCCWEQEKTKSLCYFYFMLAFSQNFNATGCGRCGSSTI